MLSVHPLTAGNVVAGSDSAEVYSHVALSHKWHTVGALLAAPSKFPPNLMASDCSPLISPTPTVNLINEFKTAVCPDEFGKTRSKKRFALIRMQIALKMVVDKIRRLYYNNS